MARVPLCGEEFESAGKAYLVLNRRLKEMDAEVELAKDRLKKIADGKPMQGGGVMVTVSNSEGRTSWEKVAMAMSVQFGVDEAALDVMKMAHKGKGSKTISVKETAEADYIYNEIIAAGQQNVSMLEVSTEQLVQPQPIW